MDFKFLAISAGEFKSFFYMNDNKLAENEAMSLEVDTNPGYPCRSISGQGGRKSWMSSRLN